MGSHRTWDLDLEADDDRGLPDLPYPAGTR